MREDWIQEGGDMEGYTQITLEQWMDWKEDVRRKLNETAENFVYIGYRLRQIRDSGMYDGAADIFEFAQREYGLGKSTVSRFIAINEKYSEGGDSLELRKEYKDFSYSKLSEMLTLPEGELSLITERTTIKEIRELKNFDRQEPADEKGTEEGTLTALQRCIIGYFQDKRDTLNKVVDAVYKGDEKTAAGLVNPSGYGTYNKGLIYLFLYSYEQGVKYRQFGQDGIVQVGWHEFLLDIYDIFGTLYESGEDDVYRAYYGRQTGEPVATSQQEGEEEPEETIQETSTDQEEKDAREQEAGEREDKEDPDTDHESFAAVEPADPADGTGAGTGETDPAAGTGCEESGVAPVQPEDEQLEGQMDITEFPQYMPETSADPVEVIPAGSSTTEDDIKERGSEPGPLIDHDGMQEHIKNQSRIIKQELSIMNLKCDERAWDELIEAARGIIVRAESLKRMQEVYEQ